MLDSIIQKEISYGIKHKPEIRKNFQRPSPELHNINGSRLVRYPNFYDFEDPTTTLGDIFLVPGFPGLQNMQVLAESLQDYGFSVYIPIYPGIGQTYSGLNIKPKGEFSFTESQKQVNTLFKALRDNSLSRIIVGGYSVGAILASNLVEKFSSSIDRVFIMGGSFHSQEVFHEVFPYKGEKGIKALEKYIHDCCTKGKVPVLGNPDEIFQDWVNFLVKSSNPENVLSKEKMPLAILHSPKDDVFPLDYASKYFPKRAKFFPLDITHMMHHLENGDAGNDVATMFYKFLKGDYDIRNGFRRAIASKRRTNAFNITRSFETPVLWTIGPGPYDKNLVPVRKPKYLDTSFGIRKY